MDPLLAIGIGIGLLAGLWTQASATLELPTWIAFIPWALFFAAGGGRGGLIKVIPSTLSGVLWGMAMIWLGGVLGGTLGLSVSIGVLAVLMCVQAKLSLLSFIPGAFAGAASYFGSGLNVKGTVIALIAGALLGWVSEFIGGRLTALGRPKAATATPVEAVPSA